jgi:hypothetical protein
MTPLFLGPFAGEAADLDPKITFLKAVFGFHCRKLGLDVTYCRTESLKGILKSCCAHDCSFEHIRY